MEPLEDGVVLKEVHSLVVWLSTCSSWLPLQTEIS